MIEWVSERELNGNYFTVYKRNNKGGEDLDYYLDKIDLENYWVYKATHTFKRVEVEEIGKYSRYMFFKKDIYCKDHIDKWIEEIKVLKICFNFLGKPFPRIGITDKIEVI